MQWNASEQNACLNSLPKKDFSYLSAWINKLKKKGKNLIFRELMIRVMFQDKENEMTYVNQGIQHCMEMAGQKVKLLLKRNKNSLLIIISIIFTEYICISVVFALPVT